MCSVQRGIEAVPLHITYPRARLSLSLSRTPHQAPAPSTPACPAPFGGGWEPLGLMLSRCPPVACFGGAPGVHFPPDCKGVGCQAGQVVTRGAGGVLGLGDVVGMTPTCSWCGHLGQLCLCLVPEVCGVGLKKPLQNSAVFLGVTIIMQLDGSQGC